MNKLFTYLTTALCCLLPLTAGAQGTKGLSKNPDKFLGNITTMGSMNTNGLTFSNLWNQVTPENESKWASVEGTQGRFNWGCDRAFDYANDNGFTFKFHALVWGAQYPNWFNSDMSITNRFNAIENWFNHVRDYYKSKYNLPMIDVVNEAVGMHQQGNPLMKESLGGGGKTGYDWLIKAFEMAYERFPNSILIYNDYNSFQNDVDNYITLVRTLRDSGAPIDAYGNQSHDVNDISADALKNVMKKQQDALKMPMFITELDVNISNDTQQRNQYEKILPIMWEADYCAGVTLWGYIYGNTWVDHSGLYHGSTPRPAMNYIKEYITSDKAKAAKSPYPGMKKRLSVFIRPKDFKVAKNDELEIKVRTHITDQAKKENKNFAIEKVELFEGNKTEPFATMTEEPYIAKYSSSTTGYKTLKAVVTTNDENYKTFERYARIEVLSSTIKREPYNNGTPIQLPGTININEYDKGAAGVSYSSPIYDYNNRKTIAATTNDGWVEYTVDVAEEGIYSFDAEVASTTNTGVFHLSEYGLDNLTYYSDFVQVPSTGSNTNFQKLHGVLNKKLTAGRHVLCLNFDKGGFYIKSITFQPYKQNSQISVTSTLAKEVVKVGETATINLKVTKPAATTIDHVDVYANDMLIGTVKDAPYQFNWVPEVYGTYAITAIAVDTDGKENKTKSANSLKIKGLRKPYNGTVISLPGTVEAENFDVGGEEVTYHDSNADFEGDAASYRSDHGGVDIKKVSGVGYTIGFTHTGEWLEYTVDVQETGTYEYDAYVSSGTTGSAFKMQLETNDVYKELSETINVPQTGSNTWNNYVPIHGRTLISLSKGEHILRINVTGESGDIDKVVFNHITVNNSLNLTVSSDPSTATVNENVTLKANTTATNVQSVKFYVDNRYIGTATEAPFEIKYRPTAKGTYSVSAEAIDADGKVSKLVKYSLKVANKRTPYSSTPISIPGTIQAENFDKGGEGLSFHDANSDGEGDNQSYRPDAEGVDIVKGNNGAAIGYTAANEWLEYTVNVKKAGQYTYKATVSSGTTNSGFRIGLMNNGKETIIGRVSVPQTGNNDWGTYKTVSGNITQELEAGEQILRFTITGASCNIDKVVLSYVEPDDITDLTTDPQPVSTKGKKVYENGQLIIYRDGKRYNALGVELR